MKNQTLDLNTIGGRIALLRIKAGIEGQSELARRLKEEVSKSDEPVRSTLSPQVVQQWEKNSTAPRRDILPFLAKILGTTQGYIYFGEDCTAAPASQKPKLVVVQGGVQQEIKAAEGDVGGEEKTKKQNRRKRNLSKGRTGKKK